MFSVAQIGITARGCVKTVTTNSLCRVDGVKNRMLVLGAGHPKSLMSLMGCVENAIGGWKQTFFALAAVVLLSQKLETKPKNFAEGIG